MFFAVKCNKKLTQFLYRKALQMASTQQDHDLVNVAPNAGS